MLFSQRHGYKKVDEVIKRETISDDLRNKIWSVLTLEIWDKWTPPSYYSSKTKDTEIIDNLVKAMWINFFKLPIDSMPEFYPLDRGSSYMFIRGKYYEYSWFDVFDFIEFILKVIPLPWANRVSFTLNKMMESEHSAYRIIQNIVVEITDESEKAEIENAITATTKGCRLHLQTAIELLSNKKNPDYRNSIKESISAVETLCKYVTSDEHATLGESLKEINKQNMIPEVLIQAFHKLYGFTNDANGIRHAVFEDEKKIDYGLAKYMLVTCSSFINYVWLIYTKK